jgi:large subunit ribosomal protein L10
VDKATKAATIKTLKARFEKAQSIVVLNYQGLTVEEVNRLRREFKKNAVDYRVVKNTLARIALKGTAFEVIANELKDTMAVAIGLDDPTQPARVAVTFAKTNEKLKVKSGALPHSAILSPAAVKDLAALPGKDELRSKFLSLLQTPPRNFLYVCTAAQRDMLGVLKAYEASKEKAA